MHYDERFSLLKVVLRIFCNYTISILSKLINVTMLELDDRHYILLLSINVTGLNCFLILLSKSHKVFYSES